MAPICLPFSNGEKLIWYSTLLLSCHYHPCLVFYTQYGPTKNNVVTTDSDAALPYRDSCFLGIREFKIDPPYRTILCSVQNLWEI